MESWLRNNNYKYVVVPDGSQAELDKLTLEYVGYWGWDVALYMNNAIIAAYNKGQRVGIVQFRAPNSLNLNKFESAEERIGYMMDVLFGKRTIDEANQLLKGGPTDDRKERGASHSRQLSSRPSDFQFLYPKYEDRKGPTHAPFLFPRFMCPYGPPASYVVMDDPTVGD